jgi:hypothetical protein
LLVQQRLGIFTSLLTSRSRTRLAKARSGLPPEPGKPSED